MIGVAILFEDVKQQIAQYEFTLNWLEESHHNSHRLDNRGLNSVEETWSVKAEIHGKDHHGLKRHRIVEGQGQKPEQAMAKMMAEISFLKLGRNADGP